MRKLIAAKPGTEPELVDLTEDEIELREADEMSWQSEKEAVGYKNERQKEYPSTGDQLDAIWKELNYRRMQGEGLTQEADDMLGKILAVKQKHPKPV